MNSLDQTPLEERLRTSLQARAQDVEASPDLWDRVDDRIRSRRRLGWLALAGAAVTAVAVGALALPGLLEDDGSLDPVIDAAPSPGQPSGDPDSGDGAAVGVATPDAWLAVRGTQLVQLAAADGAEQATWDLGVSPTRVAVRPGDGVDTVAYVTQEAGAWTVGWARLADGAAQVLGTVAASSGIPADAVSVPGAAWSPDGRELAWVETVDQGDGSVASVLQVQRWEGDDVMPGEVHPSFALAGGAAAGRMTVAGWTWDSAGGGNVGGRILLASPDGVYEVAVARDADGTIRFADLVQVSDVGVEDVASDGRGGVHALVADVPDGTVAGQPVIHRVIDLADQRTVASVAMPWFPGSPADLATAGEGIVVSSGGEMFFQVGRTGQVTAGGWSAVDFAVPAILPATASEPTGEPGDEPPPVDTAVLPGFVVTTDGTSIDLRRSNGELIQRLHTLAAEGESTIIGLDVRPGSSTEDLTIAYTSTGEGMVSAWSLRARADDQVGLDVTVQPFGQAQQPSPGTVPFADGERTIPVFSGDGDFVAWVENTGDGATLRAFGWPEGADVPGTGRTADDNVAFSRGSVPKTLEYVSDRGPSRSGGEGYYAVMTGADGTTSTCEYEVQGDGGLAEIACEADFGEDQDVTDATNQLLLARGVGGLDLLDTRATSQQALPLPDEVRGADPTRVWMTGTDSHAFVGVGGRAWLVTPEGAQDLGPDIAFAAAVR